MPVRGSVSLPIPYVGNTYRMTFGYDGLNREVSRSYTNDPQSGQGTPAVNHFYDGKMAAGGPIYTPANAQCQTAELTNPPDREIR